MCCPCFFQTRGSHSFLAAPPVPFTHFSGRQNPESRLKSVRFDIRNYSFPFLTPPSPPPCTCWLSVFYYPPRSFTVWGVFCPLRPSTLSWHKNTFVSVWFRFFFVLLFFSILVVSPLRPPLPPFTVTPLPNSLRTTPQPRHPPSDWTPKLP